MAKKFTHTYTPDRLVGEERGRLLAIRDNAVRYGANDLVQMCDDELNRRMSKKPRRTKATLGPATHDVVVGYHFVCAKDRGVTEEGQGQFRSGAWVVAESNVSESLQQGAYLALHEAKNLPSYRQGQIVGYRLAPRDMIDKDNVGIEFVVQETGTSYDWVGGGSGEKGYNWMSLSGSTE